MKAEKQIRPFIVILTSPNGENHFACFSDARVRIGRRSANEMPLQDPDVSRYHAEILIKNNQALLRDRDSTNGVFLNGARISESELKENDTFRIGRNTFLFEPGLESDREFELCIETGSNYLNRGKTDLADLVFQRAIRVKPDMADTFFLSAKALLDQEQFDKADIMVEKGLVLESKSPEAYYLKGLIHDRQGHWTEAKASYQKSIQLNPGYGLSKNRIKVLNEKERLYEKLHSLVLPKDQDGVPAKEHNWTKLESGPFRVGFHLADQIGDIEKVISTLIRAHQNMGDKLGYFPEEVPVELFSNALEFQQKVGHSTEGFVQRMAGAGAECILVQMNSKVLQDPPFLYMILTHEYVHFLLHDMTQGNCPFWLTEGMAQLESQNLTSTSMNLLEAAFRDNYLLPLEILEGPFEELEAEEVIKLAYAQSYMVVEYLIESQGYSWVREVLGALAEGKSILEVLRSSGKTYDELEKEWAEWLEGRME